MKIAIVYNRNSRNVINLFGTPNRELIGIKTIEKITRALKKGGHQVTSIEADKNLVDHLEDFMPQVVKGERPGMVFNVSYGIQGQARYTHVPSILEMMGIPYVASGPLAHSLALDKVVTKMILKQNGLPTPEFSVLDHPDAPLGELRYPVVVKPKNEAVSFGLTIAHNEEEVRAAAKVIFEEYTQAVLVEEFISGREVNVGLLGNSPPEILPPVELLFGEGAPIYTYEDKKGVSGRTISHACPAPIGEELLARAKDLSLRAFTALGCFDCARVDMRLDERGELYILEINSLPSLGEHGSYLVGAAEVGLDFDAVILRLVEVASARYFGTPQPPDLDRAKGQTSQVFSFITSRRDRLEKRLQEWATLPSSTDDPLGLEDVESRIGARLQEVGLRRMKDLSGDATLAYESEAGLDGGTLLIGHYDVPADGEITSPVFRREPEWIFGPGIASSRAPLVMLEYALRALRHSRSLRKLKLGVLYYRDEGRDCRYSAKVIREAAQRASQVLVLRPGIRGENIVTARRGLRKLRFRAEGDSFRPGQTMKKPEVLRWMCAQLEAFSSLTSSKGRVSVSPFSITTDQLPQRIPHRATSTVLLTFPDSKRGDELEEKMRGMVSARGLRWELKRLSDRPPFRDRKINAPLLDALRKTAEVWDIPLETESSVWPSVAGLVPKDTPTICGIGPVGRDLGTPQECILRLSLVKRTLLLAQFLHQEAIGG